MLLYRCILEADIAYLHGPHPPQRHLRLRHPAVQHDIPHGDIGVAERERTHGLDQLRSLKLPEGAGCGAAADLNGDGKPDLAEGPLRQLTKRA